MKVWLPILLFLSIFLRAEEGISVEVVPAQVQPGDLFEMRVVMDRAEYARFELQVPGHAHLHRAAVEKLPVRLEDGRYRQRETWMLQADSSGKMVIEGASVVLETTNGLETVNLPPMNVEVRPYSAKDESNEPVGYPDEEDGGKQEGLLGWIAGGVLIALILWWWVSRSNTTGMVGHESGASSDIELAIERLKEGQLDQRGLERLMVERDWSDEAKAALAEVVYGGRKDSAGLVELLGKEVAT